MDGLKKLIKNKNRKESLLRYKPDPFDNKFIFYRLYFRCPVAAQLYTCIPTHMLLIHFL
jgi:hypothetical protein